jgi:hypothetical protein
MLHLQQTIGNQAVLERLAAQGSSQTIQRAYSTLPVAFVGDNATTAHAQLLKYVSTEPVATGGKTFKEEYDRVFAALQKIQPSKAAELAGRLKSIGMNTKSKTEAIANARKLEDFVNYVNGLATTYQLDVAPVGITAGVTEDRTHHMKYNFQMPGDDKEKAFDLDVWSRKGEDMLKGRSAGATIKGIVNEAVTDWDPTKGSIVPLLNARLLGTTALAGESGAQNVSALFMNSPIGATYTRILMAAEHIIGVRMRDLTARGVKVQHWKKHAPTVKDNDQDGTVDWPALLSTARAAFKTAMGTTAVADQDTARAMAVKAIMGDTVLTRLRTLRVLDMDGTDGTFALDNTPKRKDNDVYQAMADPRFNFDINHFTAILFFEWKAVTDLKQ